jgi:glycine/D-amino acid oxidase-like deaminating enzyme
MIASSSDVIIIGGGIMGCSAAFFLRQRGCSVTLLERGLVGQQASGTNFGNVRRQGRPLAQLPLANRSIAIWRQMKTLLGEDVEYLQSGHIRICYDNRPELVAKLEEYARDARPLGLELEILSGTSLRRQFPFLGPEVLAGSYSPQDGHANPRLVAPAFARAAKRAGAGIVENTRIVNAEKDGEDFRVTSEDGRIFRAPVLLVTAGAWADLLCAQFGEPMKRVSRGPTMSVTEPVPYSILPAVGVFTPDEEETVYFRQIPRGNIVIGGSFRGAAFADACRAYVKPENTLSQLRQIRRLAPALGRLNIIRVWSGVEGYTPDSLPILGPSERVRGLYYAFGFSGSGFQIGPGVGDVMAELIATGATSTPIEPCRIGRFVAAQRLEQRSA